MNNKRREFFAASIFLLPNFLGFLVFVLLPVTFGVVIGFFDWDGLTWPPKWVGLSNFQKIFGFERNPSGQLVPLDGEFWKYWFNTIFIMMGIPIKIACSLLIALLLKNKIKGVAIYRTIFFLPTITAGVAIYMLWSWIFNPNYGLLNTALAYVGVEGPAWLASTVWSKPSLIVMGIWIMMGGFNMILFLAGLNNIDPNLYEAAEIDGANAFKRFWHITLPMIRPTMFFVVIMSIINGFQGGFEQAYVMTRGGPAGSTTTISYYIYNLAYRDYKMGYAAAVAVVLFMVVLCVTLFNWKFGKKSFA